eukprot:scaffold9371_cov211-Amphora_coffeaeformis.AAC.21
MAAATSGVCFAVVKLVVLSEMSLLLRRTTRCDAPRLVELHPVLIDRRRDTDEHYEIYESNGPVLVVPRWELIQIRSGMVQFEFGQDDAHFVTRQIGKRTRASVKGCIDVKDSSDNRHVHGLVLRAVKSPQLEGRKVASL